MRSLAAVVIVAASAGAAVAADRALVVGINDYPGITIDGVAGQRDLYGAVNDARAMADAVTRGFGIPPENVLLLTDSAATRQGILDAFRRHLIEGTREGDRVVFYYAGHGAQVADEGGAEEADRLDEVLVPHDGTADLARPDAPIGNAIRDDEIHLLLAELAGRDVTVIVDACNSGTITRDALAARERAPSPGYRPFRTLTPYGPLRLDPASTSLDGRLSHREETRPLRLGAYGDAFPAGPGVAVWTAVGAAEFALEDMSLGGSAGLFTSRFIRGLVGFEADRNDNGVVTPPELLAYLREETAAYCSAYDCLGQDPMPTLEAYRGYEATVMAARASPPAAGAVAALDVGAPIPRAGSAVGDDLLPGNAPSVSVSLAGGASRVGDPIAVTVTSPVAGRLLVIDRRDDGRVVQLFPNVFAAAMGEEPLIGAGETRTIPAAGSPWSIEADVAGRGVVTALVVDPSVDLGGLVEAHAALRPVEETEAYAAALSAAVVRAGVRPEGRDEQALASPARAATVARGEAAYEILAAPAADQ